MLTLKRFSLSWKRGIYDKESIERKSKVFSFLSMTNNSRRERNMLEDMFILHYGKRNHYYSYYHYPSILVMMIFYSLLWPSLLCLSIMTLYISLWSYVLILYYGDGFIITINTISTYSCRYAPKDIIVIAIIIIHKLSIDRLIFGCF